MSSKIKQSANEESALVFDAQEWQARLLHDAKALQIPIGAAETITTKIVTATEKWLKKRKTKPTEREIKTFIAQEAQKYYADLAYVCQNRGKII